MDILLGQFISHYLRQCGYLGAKGSELEGGRCRSLRGAPRPQNSVTRETRLKSPIPLFLSPCPFLFVSLLPLSSFFSFFPFLFLFSFLLIQSFLSVSVSLAPSLLIRTFFFFLFCHVVLSLFLEDEDDDERKRSGRKSRLIDASSLFWLIPTWFGH